MMALPDAESLLRQISACGMSVERRGQHLLVSPKHLIAGELRAAIRQQRHALLSMVKGEADVPCPHDVLERAAILEFCERIDRASADLMALGEFGFANWESLALAQMGRDPDCDR